MAMKQIIFAILFGVILLTISVSSTPLRKEDTLFFDWTIKTHKCDLDKCGERPVILVYPTYDKNNKENTPKCIKFPAPTIKARPGQHIQVLIRNKLDELTAIHWHGLLIRNTIFSDGVPAVTQCPIQPGTSFLYDFYANDHSGTHW
ncbi:6692_t:CDS:1 [Racocetra fulgida]|uniref:6692_t:CDS:1 n=1 Tax=Racocetra fulgida TaxID=60492 RepID=A0A9N9FHI5_9GLOM|nr:6692_t:CDS:1 [Racocetra fulgida]